MRVIATSTLRAFWERPGRGDAEQPLKTWLQIAKAAEWRTPMDVKAVYRSADVLREGRIIFDLGGNKYRLVAKINFVAGIVYVRFIGTHAEYDRIDVYHV